MASVNWLEFGRMAKEWPQWLQWSWVSRGRIGMQSEMIQRLGLAQAELEQARQLLHASAPSASATSITLAWALATFGNRVLIWLDAHNTWRDLINMIGSVLMWVGRQSTLLGYNKSHGATLNPFIVYWEATNLSVSSQKKSAQLLHTPAGWFWVQYTILTCFELI